MATNHAYILLLLLCIIVLCVPSEGVYAFGAGNIPRQVEQSPIAFIRLIRPHVSSFAFLEGKAFRHGDIVSCIGTNSRKRDVKDRRRKTHSAR